MMNKIIETAAQIERANQQNSLLRNNLREFIEEHVKRNGAVSVSEDEKKTILYEGAIVQFHNPDPTGLPSFGALASVRYGGEQRGVIVRVADRDDETGIHFVDVPLENVDDPEVMAGFLSTHSATPAE